MSEVLQGTPGSARRSPAEPTGDPLPRAARAKLLTLRGAATDARDAAASAQARLNDLQTQRNSGALPPEREDAVAQEIDRLQAVRARQNERHQTYLALVDNLHRFVQALPRGIALEAVKHVPPKLLKGENLSDALARTRSSIISIKQHRQAVASAALPKSAMKLAAQHYVQEMAARGRPRVVGDNNGFKATFGDQRSFVPQGVRAAAELLCWYDGAAVLKRLEAEIDALPTPSVVMDADERARRLADLTADLEKLEREEEAIVEKFADEGTEIPRRPDANPAAVLAVRIRTRPVRVRT